MKENEGSQNYSILIVDDVAKNIQLVAKFLTKEGYNLYFAQSGEAALKQAESIQFDLILLDIMMPGLDGFEVCRRLQENRKSSSVPIIFLTAKADDEAIAKGFDAGGVDYVTKPFNPAELNARVRTHLKLQQREKELLDMNNTKDTLLSVISHDLRTPFFNIIGLGDILLASYDSFGDVEKKELISNIVESARSSHNLLDNLLNWIRIQTGKMGCAPSNLNLKQLVDENIELANSQLNNKEISCEPVIEDTLEVTADGNMLNTIMRNLINNAIKYTPRGGHISIKAEVDKNLAIIKVIDSGIGIPEDKQASLFSQDEMHSTPGTDHEPGTGFGLKITKDFVELNKGTLGVTSKVGEGSTFYFTLPLLKSKSKSK